MCVHACECMCVFCRNFCMCACVVAGAYILYIWTMELYSKYMYVLCIGTNGDLHVLLESIVCVCTHDSVCTGVLYTVCKLQKGITLGKISLPSMVLAI